MHVVTPDNGDMYVELRFEKDSEGYTQQARSQTRLVPCALGTGGRQYHACSGPVSAIPIFVKNNILLVPDVTL